ncbi:MAG TPA: hypothetical protein VGT41_03190 [Candidatus Babeliales bacterium]|nr:hypothetical protein [Candidatus Babeliales bacterium]
MNKRLLLPILAILCISLSNNVKAERHFDLSKRTADHLLFRAKELLLTYHAAQGYVKNNPAEQISESDQQKFLQVQRDADEAKQDLIEFGRQAQTATRTNAETSLTGKTSATELLAQLKKESLQKVEESIIQTRKSIEYNRKEAIRYSELAINSEAKWETALDLNAVADLGESKRSANYHNNETHKLENKLIVLEDVLTTVEQDLERTIMTLQNATPPLTSSFTQHIKSFISNKWTKRVAGILVTCGICKLAYDRYSRAKKSNNSDESDNEENDKK